MTARDFVQYQSEDAGYQLAQVLQGWPSDSFGAKLTPDGMSAAEALEHLSEAYEALIAHNEGRKHEWGSFTIQDKSRSSLLEIWKAKREEALGGALADGGEDALKNAHAYVIAHDYYHVGQLCALRLHLDPSFDAYSIYRH